MFHSITKDHGKEYGIYFEIHSEWPPKLELGTIAATISASGTSVP